MPGPASEDSSSRDGVLPRRRRILKGTKPADLPVVQSSKFELVTQPGPVLGWTDGRNVRIDTRWGANDADRRRYAGELVALAPDVILASATPATLALQQATRTMPIVFANVADRVGAGIIESLARPGGNVTGFALFEFSLSVKWLELLKEIAPRVTRGL